MAVVLEAKGIQKRFGGTVALKNGNITCHAGKITGLLGANGSGKSTISKIITGVYLADEGEITYNGKKVHYKMPIEAKRDGISMAFQNLSLIEDLSVWQNVVIGFEKKKGIFMDNESAKTLTRNILKELLPDLNINRKVIDLSPAEMQVVEIAKAISEDPKLLILDEPTAALEQSEVRRLFDYMHKLASEGVSLIFTSHRQAEIEEICDEIVVFRNGENVGYMDFHENERDTSEIIRLITGGETHIRYEKKKKETDGTPLFEIKNLSYGKYLKEVSLTLKKGEVLGIGGLAGQGQMELMHALACGYPEAKVESVTLEGKEIKFKRPVHAVRNGVYLVPGDRQKEGLFMKDSVYFNTIFPKLGLKRPPFFTPTKKYRAQTKEIIKTLSIKTESIDTQVNNLSGGNQQKVAVGKWLPFDIKVMLLADPAKGVDVGAKKDLYEFFMKQVEEGKMSIILYASDNEELISYCDRLLIMYEGRIVQELAGDEISGDTIVAASMRV